MSFILLFFDELKGYAKSKVMIVLWFGLPLLSFLIHFFPSQEDLPISYLVAIVVSSIGGTLSSIMLSTSIVSEKNRHVYDLFLIRPVKRYNLLLVKFFAVFLCLTVAVLLSLIVGLIIDAITIELPENLIDLIFDSLVISMSSMAITCSIGIFFGVLVSSVPVAAILSVYLGSQLSSILILPTFFIPGLDPQILAIILGICITTIMMLINIILFNHKQF
jgi:ABC-type transport system involved in multi-copper enzyme maturation permease subunit